MAAFAKICIVVSVGLTVSLIAGCTEKKKPAQQPASATNVSVNPPSTLANLGLTGTASCSMRGCHGALAPALTPSQASYTTWMLHDKHAQAYDALRGSRAQHMAKFLATNPEKDARCLACHANPLLADAKLTDAESLEERTFGVGCESCHGGAKGWLDSHTGWQNLAAEQRLERYEKDGMKNLEAPEVRTGVCAGCHVGAGAGKLPLRDVNHDLIAAGHPRLMFEFSAFQANMPPHWKAKTSSASSPIQAWAVGQLASAKAALDLLADRAHRAADRRGPWPEFSEYSCYACHHDLTHPSWRQERAPETHPPGQLPWGSWYFALMPEMQSLAQPFNLATPALTKLQQTMQQPHPNPQTALSLASEAGRELTPWTTQLANTSFSPALVESLRSALEHRATDGPHLGWDSAEQACLALWTLSDADPGRASTASQEAKDLYEQRMKSIRELADRLAFDEDHQSPRGYWPAAKQTEEATRKR